MPMVIIIIDFKATDTTNMMQINFIVTIDIFIINTNVASKIRKKYAIYGTD